MDNRNEIKGGGVGMVVVVKEEDVERILRASNLKRRIRELEKEIAILQREKANLEKEYEGLGISIE